MEQLMFKLLEQTPLVIVLVLNIYYFTKQIEVKEKALEKKDKAIAKMIESYSTKMEELNEDIRNALIANSSALMSFTSTQNELRNDLKDLKK